MIHSGRAATHVDQATLLRYLPKHGEHGGGQQMERVAVAVEGPDRTADLEALSGWLSAEPDLRGLITSAQGSPAHDELGLVADVLVAAVGAGGALSVLVSSLKTFLSQPRGAKVCLKLTRPDGTTVELTADRVRSNSLAELVALVKADSSEDQ